MSFLTALAERTSEVGGPLGGQLPRDEVAAVRVGGQVDVVVPGGPVAREEVLDAFFGRADAGWVLMADERDAGRGLDRRSAVVGRRPGVAVVVRVRPDRGVDGVAGPIDRRVGQQIVVGEGLVA